MADVTAQSGTPSGVGYAKDTGTFVAPTDVINTTQFDFEYDPQPIIFSTQRPSRNSEFASAPGVGKAAGSLSYYLCPVQGAGLYKGAIGTDTLSNATDLTLTLSIAIAAADAQATFTSVPALPTGVQSWEGAILSVDTGGANPEVVPILGVAGSVLKTTPFAFAHTTGAVVKIKVQHCFQEQPSATRMLLDTLSVVAQYGTLNETRYSNGYVTQWALKGQNEQITTSMNFVFNNQPVETTTLSTLTPAAGEATDTPFVMRNGGILTPFATTDTTVAQVHNRLTSIDFSIANAVITEKWGGGNFTMEQNTVDTRKLAVQWEEVAGQNGAAASIFTNYVQTQTEAPLFFFWFSPKTQAAQSIFMPRAVITKYKKVGAMGQTVKYQGMAQPLEGSNGYSVRSWLLNGISTAY